MTRQKEKDFPGLANWREVSIWEASLVAQVVKHMGAEKAMATHSSVLAWRIPGTGEPGGLPSMGSHRVWHDWNDLAAASIWEKLMGHEC